MINLSEKAKQKLKIILEEENNPNIKLRIFIQGGGCSGMQYGFTFDEEQNEDDYEFEFDGVKIIVDSMSGQYLQGADIDYKEDLMSSGFSIKNPNAVSSCGCGSSFSV